MADRNVTFTLSAKDDFSATFGRFEKDLASLRSNLNLPLTGPLSKGQQQLENAVVARVRAMEVAGQRARLEALTNEAIGGPAASGRPSRFNPEEQAIRNAWARQLRANRGTPDFSDVPDYMADVTRLRGGQSPRQSTERLDELARLKKDIKIAAGYGTAVAAINATAEGIDAYDAARRTGSSKLQGLNAAIQEVAPGAKAANHIKDYLTGKLEADRKLDEAQDNREARESLKDRRDAKRQAIGLEGKAVGEDAFDRLQLRGTEGTARTIAAAQQEAYKENRRLDELLGKKGSLSPEQAEILKGQVAAGRAAAQADQDFKIKEATKAFNIATENDRRAHVDRLRQIDEDADAASLAASGQSYALKLKQVRDERDKEIEAARREAADAKLDADKDGDVADRRAAERIAEIEKRAAAQKNAIEIDQRREIALAGDAHKQQLLDSEGDIASRRLALAGRTTDAEKLVIRKGYLDRLNEIRKNEEQQIHDHAERRDEFVQQAKEDAAAAAESAGLSLEELRERRRVEFKAPAPGGISGEAGLLTGVVGPVGMGALQNLVGVNERTARAAEASMKANIDMADKIGQLLAAIEAGTLAVVPN